MDVTILIGACIATVAAFLIEPKSGGPLGQFQLNASDTFFRWLTCHFLICFLGLTILVCVTHEWTVFISCLPTGVVVLPVYKKVSLWAFRQQFPFVAVFLVLIIPIQLASGLLISMLNMHSFPRIVETLTMAGFWCPWLFYVAISSQLSNLSHNMD